MSYCRTRGSTKGFGVKGWRGRRKVALLRAPTLLLAEGLGMPSMLTEQEGNGWGIVFLYLFLNEWPPIYRTAANMRSATDNYYYAV